MKKIWTNWQAPTPAKWRKIGSALLAGSTFLSGCILAADPKYHWIAIISVVLGFLGKEITNLATDDNEQK
jgi:hypothetical protein